MTWTQKIVEYCSQKYLFEIIHELWSLYRKEPIIEQSTESHSISMDIYLLFNPAELDQMPPPLKALIDKGVLQNTFMTDQAQKDSSTRQRESPNALSTKEIRIASQAIASYDSRSVLPDLDNLLFRDGMTKKEFIWSQMLGMLQELPNLYSPEEIAPFLALKQGKIIFWEQGFLNMNHRHPELYSIYLYSRELRPNKDLFCSTFHCDRVIFDRHPPYSNYILIHVPMTSGIIIAFQE
ncbi:hypothetical protein JXQ70_11155 [bacterium]|nr:hypothetical protein [bacterium]